MNICGDFLFFLIIHKKQDESILFIDCCGNGRLPHRIQYSAAYCTNVVGYLAPCLKKMFTLHCIHTAVIGITIIAIFTVSVYTVH